jgi:hypothetical protein
MSHPVTTAKWIFRIAGIYGLIVLIPFFFAEDWVGRNAPPAITHPEYYYGFIGAATVMQLIYLTISADPDRYRPLMPIAVLAKLSFAVPVSILFLTGRLEAATLPLPAVDLLLGLAFGFAWLRMRRTA